MRKVSLTLVISFLVSLPLLGATAAGHAAAGRAALDRDEHQKAADLFEKAITLEPKNAEYHYLAGAAYGDLAQRAGLLSKASLATRTRAAFEKAVELDPGHTQARFGLISYYLLAPSFLGGGEDKALAQAAELKRRDALDGHRAFARIYSHQKKPDLARKEFVDGVREQPNLARAHYLLGVFLMSEKNWPVALRELDAAVTLDAAYMPSYFRIGQHAARSGSNYARGEEMMRKYLAHKPAKDEPALADSWYWLGQIQQKQGKKAEARSSYTTALKLAPGDKDIIKALEGVS